MCISKKIVIPCCTHACLKILFSFIVLPCLEREIKILFAEKNKISQTFQMISCSMSFLITASISGVFSVIDLTGSVQVFQFYLDYVSSEVCVAKGLTLW